MGCYPYIKYVDDAFDFMVFAESALKLNYIFTELHEQLCNMEFSVHLNRT